MTESKKDQMMRKVRGLLAKAEDPGCTPEEAEAFSRKAEELIATYAIDLALLTEKRGHNRGKPTTRTIDLDANYKTPRATIIDQIARALGCKLVLNRHSVTVVGFEADLDLLETLAGSLLLQAANGMLADSRASGRTSTDLWRFRQDHLFGFAYRAGERLREVYQAKADEKPGAGLVLRDRSREVSEAFNQMFPKTKDKQARIGHSGGYNAGRARADKADLGQTRFGGGRKAIA